MVNTTRVARAEGVQESSHSLDSLQVQETTTLIRNPANMSLPNSHHQDSPASPSTMGIENLHVRDRRRDAIYGAENFEIVGTGPAPSPYGNGPLRISEGGSVHNPNLNSGPPNDGCQTRRMQTRVPDTFTHSQQNPSSTGSTRFHSGSRVQHPPNSTIGPVVNEGQSQIPNSLPDTIETLPTATSLSAESGNLHTMRSSRLSGQSRSRRDSSVLQSDEDLNIPQEERPWHEDKWPGFGGYRQVGTGSTNPCGYGQDIAHNSESEHRGPTVTQGDAGVKNAPQPQPNLLSNDPAPIKIDESQDAGLPFLPFVQVEHSNHPSPSSEQTQSDLNSVAIQKLGINNSKTEFVRSSHLHCISKPSVPRPFEVHRTPENSYTSPKRMENVLKSSKKSLKRKRDVSDSPPPAYVYVRINDPNFDIFSNGFLLYPELCFALAAQMPLRDLVNLYAISKDFHTIIDSRFTTVCVSQALRKAPESAKTFRYRFYSQYCRSDPAARIPHPDPAKAELSIPRLIPSFRWVAFILHREKVVHELMTVFAERACPLPPRCSLALKKMWLIMDIPENARRIGIMHNPRFITDTDLYFMMCVIVKLDMIANDPLAAEKRDGLRRLLFSQEHGLDVMNKVLKREMWRKKSDYLAAYIRNNTNIEAFTTENLNMLGVDGIFGVPRDEVGLGKFEYWGKKGIKDPATGIRRPYLMRPDQLVQREAVRRGINFSGHYFRCVLYGYIDPNTLEDYGPREYSRRIPEWKDEDYDILDSVGGFRALSVEDGGDPLLDLGDTRRGSPYIVKKEPVSEQEKAMRQSHDAFTKRMYELSKMDQDAEKARKKEKRRLQKAKKAQEEAATKAKIAEILGKGQAHQV